MHDRPTMSFDALLLREIRAELVAYQESESEFTLELNHDEETWVYTYKA